MKTNSLLKYLTGAFILAGLFASAGLKAQSVDQTGILEPIKDHGIVYAAIEIVDGDNDGTIDCSFNLSESEISTWGDYSTAIALYGTGIQVRNGGGFENTKNFPAVAGQVLHFWMDVDVTAKTYSTFFLTEGMTEVDTIFMDAGFRNTAITNILRWSTLHNPDAEPDTAKVLKVAQVEAVGITGNYAMSLPGGADGSVSNVALPAFNVSDLPLTIEAWVYPMAKNDYGAVLYSRGSTTNGGVQFDKWTNPNTLRGIDAAGVEIVASNDPVFNAWNHVAYVLTATDMTMYINGVATTNSADVPTLFTMDAGNYIGWDAATPERTIEGYFDEVRIWSSARTSDEITDNKFEILNGDEEGLVAYYNFNDSATMATDLTANAYHGTINGGTYVESNYMDLSIAEPVVSLSESIPVMVEKDHKGYPVYITSTNTDAALGIVVPEGFTATPASLTAANFENGEAKVVIDVTTAAVGDSGSVVITYEGEGLDSIGVEAVDAYQRYMFKEAEGGMFLGSASSNDFQPSLTDSMNVAAQHFILRPVNEGMDDSLFYIVQDVDYRFFSKKSSSGWSTMYGSLEDGVWKVVKGVTDYYTFMNVASGAYAGADGTANDSWYYADKTGGSVDSFMMYEAPRAVIPAVLAHSYTFEIEDTVIDMIGDLNGTLVGDSITVANGKATVSNAASNTDGYIAFDAAAMALNTYDAISLEAYIETGNTLNTSYTMLAYFGNNTGGSRCFWIQPTRDGNESRIETNDGTNTVTAALSGVEIDDGKLHHVVAVLSPDSLLYYLDGVLVSGVATDGDFISTLDDQIAQLFKGPDSWGDPNYNASLEEFNIYNGELDAETIADRSQAYLGASDSRLGSLSSADGELMPEFSPSVKQYVLSVTEGTASVNIEATAWINGAIVTGAGAVTVDGNVDTAEVKVVSIDGTDSTMYTVYIMAVDPNCYSPLYPELENMVSDPELTDISLWGGWGTRSIYYGPEAYCGTSCAILEAPDKGCVAALDIADVTWKPNTTYQLHVMVKTIDGSIGFLASSTDPNFGFSVDTEGEWMMVDTTFTTGSNAGTNFFSFNTCDYSSNCTAAYIDNYELYELPSAANEDMTIYLYTPDDRDDMQYDWLMQQGFNVEKVYTASLAANTDLIDSLNAADLVIIGRSPSSGDFDEEDKTAWNNLTVPVILNTQWAARNSRLNWFNSSTAYHANTDPAMAYATIGVPEDEIFTYVTLLEGDSMKWCMAPHDFVEVTEPHNGTTLAIYNGNSPLVTRFETGTEFYEGAVDMPAGPRTYFGFGNDDTGVDNFFPLYEDAQKVYYAEIRRIMGMSVEEPVYTVNVSTEKIRSKADVSVYPTISSGSFTVKFASEPGMITVYTMSGQVIEQIMPASSVQDVSVDGSGVFIIRAESKGNSKVFKVLKTN